MIDVVQHFSNERLGGEIVLNGLLFAVVGAQDGVVIGIGQAANVKNKVGIGRHAVFKAKRNNAYQQCVVVYAYPLGNDVAQLLGA